MMKRKKDMLYKSTSNTLFVMFTTQIHSLTNFGLVFNLLFLTPFSIFIYTIFV